MLAEFSAIFLIIYHRTLHQVANYFTLIIYLFDTLNSNISIVN